MATASRRIQLRIGEIVVAIRAVSRDAGAYQLRINDRTVLARAEPDGISVDGACIARTSCGAAMH